EGVRFAGYRTICMTGIRDPFMIDALDGVLSDVQSDARARYSDGNFQVLFRQYGRNAVMGNLEPESHAVAHELGLLIEVVADSQALADAVCMYVRGSIQHAYYPGIVATAGNLAYPFSPFTIPCGPVYQWHIDHLVAVADPCELFPMEVEIM